MAKTIKITSNNEISVVDVDFDDYRAIQKVVGGMFETVKTQRMFDYFGKPVMMLVDEEGILKQLPLNRTLYFQYRISSTGNTGPAGMHKFQHPVSGTSGRVIKPLPKPTAWPVLHGPL